MTLFHSNSRDCMGRFQATFELLSEKAARSTEYESSSLVRPLDSFKLLSEKAARSTRKRTTALGHQHWVSNSFRRKRPAQPYPFLARMNTGFFGGKFPEIDLGLHNSRTRGINWYLFIGEILLSETENPCSTKPEAHS